MRLFFFKNKPYCLLSCVALIGLVMAFHRTHSSPLVQPQPQPGAVKTLTRLSHNLHVLVSALTCTRGGGVCHPFSISEHFLVCLPDLSR